MAGFVRISRIKTEMKTHCGRFKKNIIKRVDPKGFEPLTSGWSRRHHIWDQFTYSSYILTQIFFNSLAFLGGRCTVIASLILPRFIPIGVGNMTFMFRIWSIQLVSILILLDASLLAWILGGVLGMTDIEFQSLFYWMLLF